MFEVLKELFYTLVEDQDRVVIKIKAITEDKWFPPQDIQYSNDPRLYTDKEFIIENQSRYEGKEISASNILEKYFAAGYIIYKNSLNTDDSYHVSRILFEAYHKLSEDFTNYYNKLKEKYPHVIIKNPEDTVELVVYKRTDEYDMTQQYLRIVLQCKMQYIIEGYSANSLHVAPQSTIILNP